MLKARITSRNQTVHHFKHLTFVFLDDRHYNSTKLEEPIKTYESHIFELIFYLKERIWYIFQKDKINPFLDCALHNFS